MKLKGKVAVVTGAGGGVGKAITKRIASEGGKVVLLGRDRSKLIKVIGEIKEKKNLLAVKADITKEAEVINGIEQTISTFDTIDILVNSAGLLTDPTPFHLTTEDEWMLLINTNLLGTFRTTEAVPPFNDEK